MEPGYKYWYRHKWGNCYPPNPLNTRGLLKVSKSFYGTVYVSHPF